MTPSLISVQLSSWTGTHSTFGGHWKGYRVVKRIGHPQVIVPRLHNITLRMNYFSNMKHSVPKNF